jgi:cell division protein FtsZ
VDEAANRIRKEVGDEEANIIFGSSIDDDMAGRIRVSVVATGMEATAAARPRPSLVAVAGAPVARPVAATPPPAPVVAPPPQVVVGNTVMQPEPAPIAASAPPVVEPFAAAEPAPQPAPAAPAAEPTRTLFSPLETEPRSPAPPAPSPAPAGTVGRGLFQRMTRLMGGGESEPAPRTAPSAQRAEPILSPVSEPVPRATPRRAPTDEAGLDIPAFLRRQAN